MKRKGELQKIMFKRMEKSLQDEIENENYKNLIKENKENY